MLTATALRRLPLSARPCRSVGRPTRFAPQPALVRRPPVHATYHHGARPASKKQSARSATAAVALLVGGNAYVAYLLFRIDSRDEGLRWAANALTSPMHVRAGRFHTLLTSTFAHLTYSDLLLNMGGLVAMGPSVARAIGTTAFLSMYATCGVASAVVAVVAQVYNGENAMVCGAGGAVNATAVLYVALHERGLAAPLLYFTLRTLALVVPPLESESQQYGYASGTVWGAMYARSLCQGLRLIR